MKNNMKFAVLIVTLGIFSAGNALAYSPGTPEHYFEQQIQGLWQEDAANKDRIEALESTQGSGTDQTDRITQLESENRALKSQLDWMETKINTLAAKVNQAPTVGGTVNTTIVEQADMTRVAALEKRVSVLEQVISMMEVNIGSIYAYVDQALAPIKKLLKLK